MKTIIIHHLQYMWDSGLRSYGTSFEEELDKVVNHLEDNHYDKVIVTNFEADFYLDEHQYDLDIFSPTVHDYMPLTGVKAMIKEYGAMSSIVNIKNIVIDTEKMDAMHLRTPDFFKRIKFN